jgi:hypothetical protein
MRKNILLIVAIVFLVIGLVNSILVDWKGMLGSKKAQESWSKVDREMIFKTELQNRIDGLLAEAESKAASDPKSAGITYMEIAFAKRMFAEDKNADMGARVYQIMAIVNFRAAGDAEMARIYEKLLDLSYGVNSAQDKDGAVGR